MYILTYILKNCRQHARVSKFDAKLWIGERHFRKYHIHVSCQILRYQLVIFFYNIYFFQNSSVFLKILVTLFATENFF